MISELDLSVYQALFQHKKLTEKYIGKVEFYWVYSEVHYTAKCTVGVPFDLFDKTIVGILLVDEVLSIEEIGDILGMNLVHNPDKQQYKDDAEYDILRMALDNLYQYKMIEIGDTSYSSCRLTSIGKEYAQKGRKFKIEKNKPFALMYDHTGTNHLDAKKSFQKLKGENQPLLTNGFDFLDETLMKQIASNQANEVYDDKKGNSFTDPKINRNRSQSFLLKLFVALLYDLKDEKFRFLAYEPTTKTINEYFSNWLTDNKLEEIIEQFRNDHPIDNFLPALTQEYVQTVVQIQKDFEKEVAENPTIALALQKQVNKALHYIDFEYFWNNLNEFVSDKTRECWFFLPEPNGKCLSLIEKFANEYPATNVFVAVNSQIENADVSKQIDKFVTKSELLTNNLIAVKFEFVGITNFKFWKLENSLIEYSEQPVVVANDFYFNSLVKSNTPISEINYKPRKTDFAKRVLPLLIANIAQTVSDVTVPKNVDKSKILSFQDLDKKALAFTDLQEHEDILHQILQIEQQKNNFIAKLQEKHKAQLLSELQKLITDFDKQEFSKLEPLQDFLYKTIALKSELLEDYEDLKECIITFENKINAAESHIKDEILAKTYIIDTNVFIEEPEIISKIDSKHYVVLSHTVINELDKLKQKDKLKEKATKAIAILNKLLGKNKQLRTAKANTTILGEDYQQNSPDNRILSVAFMYKDKNPILLTNDNGLQLKAKSISIPAISLKDFLSIKDVSKKIIESNSFDYRAVFNQIQPNKKGNYQISSFIEILRKQNSEFDYKMFGFEKAWQFVESLGIFEIKEKQFLNLKS